MLVACLVNMSEHKILNFFLWKEKHLHLSSAEFNQKVLKVNLNAIFTGLSVIHEKKGPRGIYIWSEETQTSMSNCAV